MNLGQKIRNLRSQKGWTQGDLAKFSGVSLGSIKRYETDSGNITYSNLQKIANALNVKVENLSLSMSPSPVSKLSPSSLLVQNNAEIKFKNLIELFEKLTEKEQKFYLLDMETRILKRELEKEQ